ncbi:NAD(P)H-binding protein [Streptomyces sp. NPDC127079]|uniref:NAD(P)H-binding protein n=1 Tax=Streptomyces sp. NPDC127079 TaxID=3347132 RepID=UPI00364D968E
MWSWTVAGSSCWALRGTGQRVLRELLKRGAEPTPVGRSRARMRVVADRFGVDLPVAEADLTSAADLSRLLESSDVAVSTVGPFMELGMATVTAAARAGPITSTPLASRMA